MSVLHFQSSVRAHYTICWILIPVQTCLAYFSSLVWEFFLQSLVCSCSGSVIKLKHFSPLLLQWTVELYSSLLESNQISSEVRWDCFAVLIQQKLSIQTTLRRAGKYENSSVIGNYTMTYFLYITNCYCVSV